ncbi:MAG: hypothetical protein ABII19_01750 [Patescibacteria group bacterium]
MTKALVTMVAILTLGVGCGDESLLCGDDTCPNVAGTWDVVYHSWPGEDIPLVFNIEQNGCSLSASTEDEICTFIGWVDEESHLYLSGTCDVAPTLSPPIGHTLVGDLTSSTRGEGEVWIEDDPPAGANWTANRR